MKKLSVAIATLLFAAQTFNYAAAADHLAAPEIQKQVIGPSLSSKTRSGKPFTVVFSEGGKGLMDIGKIGKFDATWHIDGDKMCWKIPGEPDECSFVVAGKGKLTFVDATSGKTNNVYAVK